jgi:hypothetical protein
MTTRGRAQLKTVTEVPHAEDQGRQGHEAGADMRACIVSGPFITGSL